MGRTETFPVDLNSPCREISNGGLGFVVALSVRWQINFSCVYSEGPIQLYVTRINFKGDLSISDFDKIQSWWKC